MKCKITDNGKLSIEFDVESEKDIDAIVEEFDLAVKPSELRLLKNTLNACVKNKVQRFLFDNETVKQPTIDVDDQNDDSDTVDTRAITLFSKLGYNVNDENVKILIDSFDELNRNKILSFASSSSTNPKMLLTFFNVFNYDSVIRIDENVIEVLDWVDLYQIEPVYKEHDDVQDVSWGVEKSTQLPTHEFAKVVDDGERAQTDN